MLESSIFRQTSAKSLPKTNNSSKGVRKVGLGVETPLSLIFYKNFITWAKEINCFRILFLVNLST